MAKMISVYLPVEDLEASIRFYLSLGCSMIRRADIDQVSTLVWSETITFLLMTHPTFAGFTPKAIADAKKSSEMVIMLTLDSRKEVDAVVETAASYGGKADIRAPMDRAGIYRRSHAHWIHDCQVVVDSYLVEQRRTSLNLQRF